MDDITVIKHLLSNKWYIVAKQGLQELKMSPTEISGNFGLYNAIKHQLKLKKDKIYSFSSFILRDETIFVNPIGSKIEIAKYSYVRDEETKKIILELYNSYLEKRRGDDFGFIKRYKGDRTNIKLLAEDTVTTSTAIAEIYCDKLLTP